MLEWGAVAFSDVNVVACHKPTSQGPHCLVSSTPSSCNLICNLLLFYVGAELIYNVSLVLGARALDPVMHRWMPILSVSSSTPGIVHLLHYHQSDRDEMLSPCYSAN